MAAAVKRETGRGSTLTHRAAKRAHHPAPASPSDLQGTVPGAKGAGGAPQAAALTVGCFDGATRTVCVGLFCSFLLFAYAPSPRSAPPRPQGSHRPAVHHGGRDQRRVRGCVLQLFIPWFCFLLRGNIKPSFGKNITHVFAS